MRCRHFQNAISSLLKRIFKNDFHHMKGHVFCCEKHLNLLLQESRVEGVKKRCDYQLLMVVTLCPSKDFLMATLDPV